MFRQIKTDRKLLAFIINVDCGVGLLSLFSFLHLSPSINVIFKEIDKHILAILRINNI